MESSDREADSQDREEKNASNSAFLKSIEALSLPEEKISKALQVMREALSQEGTAHFRQFWEVRQLILPLFKESLNPIAREKLWAEFVELTVEARRLKDILEEQSAFAIEQIELAISAVEQDLAKAGELLSEMNFPKESLSLQGKEKEYVEIQNELNFLNTLASRLTQLRKEISGTDMRIRSKTKLFKKISELGDQVFPKRKELIEKISAQFESDVEAFIQEHFPKDGALTMPYYALKEEIKALQSAAKTFTLSSSVFRRTRLKLSECWDQVRSLEKERRQEQSEKREASSEQRKAFDEKIAALQEKNLSLTDLQKEIDVILQEMRNVSLQREDVRALKNALYALKEPQLEEEKKQREQRELVEKEKQRVKREKIDAFQASLSQLMQEQETLEFDALKERFESLNQECEALEITKGERSFFQKQLRPIKARLEEKKQEALLNLDEDDKRALESFKTVLDEKKRWRQDIKEQLEIHRKTLGTSGLDFQKAMELSDLIDQEKDLLEKANLAIEEIEEKIAELES